MHYFKSLVMIMGLLFLAGCYTQGKKSIFSKESDTLSKSPCASHHQEPFYVNGKWVN